MLFSVKNSLTNENLTGYFQWTVRCYQWTNHCTDKWVMWRITWRDTQPSNQQEDWLLLLHHHYITSSRRMQAYWPPYLMNGLMHIKSIVTQSLKLRTFTDNNYSYWLGCQSSVLFTDNSFYAFPQQSPYCCSALNTQSIQLYPSVFERAVKYARWKTLYIAEIFNNVCCL